MTNLLSPVDAPGPEAGDALVPGNGAQAASFNYYAVGRPAY